MTGQDTIRSTPVTRMASLAGAGAKVGLNYLKHYGRRALGHESNSLDEDNAEAIFKTFSELKGGPLKLAQMLSIDQNLLPPAYARQFARAQYSAPPLSYPLVAKTFRREFGRDPLAIFDDFTREAVHGASIGQVHRAQKWGKSLAVKVQYPGVAESLSSDLRVVKPFALQVLGLRESDIAAYIQEVETKLLEETNYVLERSRAVQISAACSDIPNIRFPNYYPEVCSAKILTMEWIDGETLDQFADGDASQDARDRVGQALWDFYDRQVHTMKLFHADPHPGNFLVRDGEVWVLDFGCTKEIDADFHRKQFRFVDPGLLEDEASLIEALEALDVLLPSDSPHDRARVLTSCRQWLGLLAAPFHAGTFDFGNERFLHQIYELGEESRRDKLMRNLRGRRGSPDTIYVNRAFFGLYSLLSRLRARIKTSMPVHSSQSASPMPSQSASAMLAAVSPGILEK